MFWRGQKRPLLVCVFEMKKKVPSRQISNKIKSKDHELGTRWGPQRWSPPGDKEYQGVKKDLSLLVFLKSKKKLLGRYKLERDKSGNTKGTTIDGHLRVINIFS